MKRERIDKTMSREVINRLILPVVEDFGARHIVGHPYLGAYDHENKHLTWGLGHKRHGDKRHRTSVKFGGIHYADGEQTEGKTTTVEIDHRIGWSRKLDNRKVANHVTVSEKIMSYEETFNKLRTLTSLDIVNNFSASAQGEIAGIGGSVSSSQLTFTSVHTEVETEKFNHTKKEKVIDDTTVLDYPGPVLLRGGRLTPTMTAPLFTSQGSVKYEGEIWLVERPVVTLQTGHSDDAVGHLGLRAPAPEHLRLGGKLRRPAGWEAQERAGP